ncbi:MAG: TonB-dependent receptor, partial [Proteobacteria bacterium]
YWSATAGARFDDYNLTDISSQKISASGLSPNLGLRYALTKEQGLFVSHTRAFRGPTPIEAFVLAGATSAVSNPNIEGTRSETTELGWEQRKEILRARVTGFYTKFNHPLDNVTIGGVATRQNVPDIKSQGFVVSADSLLNNWELGASYTHVRLSFGDEPIGYSGATSFSRGAPTGDRANARIGYRFTPLNLIASFSSLMIMKLDRLPSGQAVQPGYEVYDANLAWVPNDQLQVNFSVQNLFDKNYVAQGTPYLEGFRSVYEPGRDFRLSASYMF